MGHFRETRETPCPFCKETLTNKTLGPHTAKHHPVTTAEKNEWVSLYKKGENVKDIAKAYNRTGWTVYGYLKPRTLAKGNGRLPTTNGAKAGPLTVIHPAPSVSNTTNEFIDAFLSRYEE